MQTLLPSLRWLCVLHAAPSPARPVAPVCRFNHSIARRRAQAGPNARPELGMMLEHGPGILHAHNTVGGEGGGGGARPRVCKPLRRSAVHVPGETKASPRGIDSRRFRRKKVWVPNMWQIPYECARARASGMVCYGMRNVAESQELPR